MKNCVHGISPGHCGHCDGRPPTPVEGTKLDQGKARWDLLPWAAVEEVVDVLTYGAQKYSPDGWRRVPDAKSRYFAAALRHIAAYAQDETDDSESGQHHLAHAVCCLLFLLELFP